MMPNMTLVYHFMNLHKAIELIHLYLFVSTDYYKYLG